jgi:hypothetical protein
MLPLCGYLHTERRHSWPLAGCDVSLLCAKQPDLFYGVPDKELLLIPGRYRELQEALPGLDVDDMITEDPKLLFSEVAPGLREMRDLWDLDAEAWRNSETFMVALALRALSPGGPPHRF